MRRAEFTTVTTVVTPAQDGSIGISIETPVMKRSEHARLGGSFPSPGYLSILPALFIVAIFHLSRPVLRLCGVESGHGQNLYLFQLRFVFPSTASCSPGAPRCRWLKRDVPNAPFPHPKHSCHCCMANTFPTSATVRLVLV